MSKTRIAALIIVAGASLSSCARPASPVVGLYTRTYANFPILIDFKCDSGVTSIGLTTDDATKEQAWSAGATNGQSISWHVPTNVTIDSIMPKTGNSLPVDHVHHTVGGGQAYNATVNASGHDVHYPYSIKVTCTPSTGGGNPVQLVIDPDMIVL